MRISPTTYVNSMPRRAPGGSKAFSMNRTIGSALALLLVLLGTIVSGSRVAAKPDTCVAANGEVRMQNGTATCAASGTGSVAIVKGDGSTAYGNRRGPQHGKGVRRQ